MKVHFQIAERSLFYLNPDIQHRRMTYPPERKRVRSHLLANNIVDKESFDDYMSELV